MENINGLTPAETERLSVLSEELGESVKAIGKILRHGYESTNPNKVKESNRSDLETELGDVEAAMTMMYAAGDLAKTRVVASKHKKLNKPNRYLHHQPKDVLRPRKMLVVAGSRSYNNYDEFCKTLERYLDMIGPANCVIVSGAAKKGPDAMAIRWCEENNFPYIAMPADWDQYGKQAGYIRNADMGKVATHLLAFWDKVSNGTKNMVEIALSKEIPTLVALVQPDTYTP